MTACGRFGKRGSDKVGMKPLYGTGLPRCCHFESSMAQFLQRSLAQAARGPARHRLPAAGARWHRPEPPGAMYRRNSVLGRRCTVAITACATRVSGSRSSRRSARRIRLMSSNCRCSTSNAGDHRAGGRIPNLAGRLLVAIIGRPDDRLLFTVISTGPGCGADTPGTMASSRCDR